MSLEIAVRILVVLGFGALVLDLIGDLLQLFCDGIYPAVEGVE